MEKPVQPSFGSGWLAAVALAALAAAVLTPRLATGYDGAEPLGAWSVTTPCIGVALGGGLTGLFWRGWTRQERAVLAASTVTALLCLLYASRLFPIYRQSLTNARTTYSVRGWGQTNRVRVDRAVTRGWLAFFVVSGIGVFRLICPGEWLTRRD